MLEELIEAELAGVRDQRVVDHIRKLLVPPNIVLREWDYGAPGQTFPCWTVLDDRKGSGSGIAFSEFGFGPECPWGLVAMGSVPGRSTSMGMDSGWFTSFMEAFFESFMSTQLAIWRVMLTTNGYPGEPLTDELSWEEAWTQYEALNDHGPGRPCIVHHTIEYGATAP